MPEIENILLTFVCGAICDGLFQRKFCKLTRWACPATPWCWPGPGSAPPGAGAEAAEAASSPPRSWWHQWWGHNNQRTLEQILGSSAGEICTLLLISDFYLRWRNPSVTISDQSVRRVTTNHLCHECHAELITRDTPSLWSLIVTSLSHHGQYSREKCSSSTSLPQSIITVTPLFWLHSPVDSHWLQFSQTLDSV